MHPDILRLHAAIEENHWWFKARRRIVTELLHRVVPPGKSKRILDLGCGTGGNLGQLCQEYSCMGLELDPDAVSFAVEQYPDCEFRCASVLDFDSWPLREEADACLLMDVLEHLDDDRLVVENATRALRPGGHLLITVPADPSLWSRHDRHHKHRRRYTLASLQALFGGLSLEPRLVTAFNARLYPPIKAWRILQNRVPWLADRGTTGDLSMPPALVNRFLTRLFSGESTRICRALDNTRSGYAQNDDGHARGGHARGAYARGVSLLALYRLTRIRP